MTKLQSLYYFFFPPTDRIWIDAVSGIDDNGREHHQSYTLRNLVVYLKSELGGFSLKRRIFFEIGFIPKKGWMVGAVVFDASAAAVTGANPSFSHTCTGSNLVLILTTVSGNSADPTAATYAGAALILDVSKNSAINGSNQTIWHKLSPATGSNTMSVTHTGGRVQVASYTGVSQSGFPDASASSATDQSRVGAGNITYTLTVVATGCWVVQTNEDNVLNPTGGVIAGTLRGGEAVYGSGRVNDSNGTVSTGAISVGYSYSGSNSMTGVAISFAPATEVQTTDKFFLMF